MIRTGTTPDVLVVGAGVMGLWCARACLDLGLRVEIADAAGPGAGASASPVGALTPVDPTRWSDVAALQLDGLTRLPGEISALEDATGKACGYRRLGRVQPLASPKARGEVDARIGAAALRWGAAGTLRWRSTAPPDLSPGAAPEGVLADDLSARVDPEAYLAALAADVGVRAKVRWGAELTGVERGCARFETGRVPAGHIVLAMGWQTPALVGGRAQGTKGQAAAVRVARPLELPIVTSRGLFIVPHGSGRVGVGSTHEPSWTRSSTDAQLEDILAAATRLCPALDGAEVLMRWAGVRPKAPGRGPMVGEVPDRPGIWVATGTGGIGYAVAHVLGRALADAVVRGGDVAGLPESFGPRVHLSVMPPTNV